MRPVRSAPLIVITFFFNDTATTEIYTLSLHDALPIFLFIGHDASKTGAPTVLLHLLRWIKQNRSDYFFDLLLLTGGELETEFRKVCDVHVLRRRVDGKGLGIVFLKIVRFLRKKLGGERRLLSILSAKWPLV